MGGGRGHGGTLIPRAIIPSTGAETILVVDDCKDVCELIGILLYRAGYRVLTATHGAAALEIARDTHGNGSCRVRLERLPKEHCASPRGASPRPFCLPLILTDA